ncbi:MAG: MFS transporter [Oscillospiraceae bacterium]|nr:MFS transporter [Oscillospiraceae bacterium]
MSQKLFNRDFTLVAIGQLISLFGNAILRFALALYVLDATGSAAVFGSVTAIAVIPTILLSPFGGILSDRVNRRNIMVSLDFATAALALGLGLLLSEENAVALITVTLLLLSVIQACYTPSVNSSVPLLQAEGNLVKANAVVSQVSMLANLIGPVLGGVLYGFFGAMPIILVSGVCFFLSAVLELFIHIPFQTLDAKTGILQIVKDDLRESIRFMTREQPDILRITLMIAVYSLFVVSTITVGLPYMVRTVLGLSSQLYGAAEGLMAAAGIAGGIASGFLAGRLKTGRLYWLLVLSGAALVPVGAAFLLGCGPMTCYIVITICIMAMQLLIALFSIFMLSLAQGRTPSHLLGKMTAYIMTLTMCAQPVGQALYGVLFDRFAGSLYLPLIATALIAAAIGLASRGLFARLEQ